jgi:nucleoside-diphosphate-sugar epimerase
VKRAIITGGSGFIGTNLLTHLAEQGWQVASFDVVSPRNRYHEPYWQQCDLLDRDDVARQTQAFRPSVFLHFGARTDLDERKSLAGYAANIEGVRNVVETIRATPSVQRVIFASSQLVCHLGYRPEDEYDFCPSTLYGQSKAIGEKIVRSASDIGAVWTIVRPTSLWGPWFDVPYKNFFTAIARNIYFHPGKTKTLKQWGYVGNTAYQIQKLLEAPAEQIHRSMFYLADYEPVPLRDFANQVQQAIGARPIRTMPAGLLRAAGRVGDLAQKAGWQNPPLTSFRYGNIVTSELQDLEPLREVVGQLPFSLRHGIENTLRWLRGDNGLAV